ncbi:hypothetical protein [Rhizobium indigoferae]|uniref:Uncharacterized protein n=1 Tax=Rhizobium indigoferae TaxID=158891 RepID=A0ABZ1DY31_9HYPH|nr:hypothetical protein [Rhizobium indigoferae]NNU53124.1 hypothetical protein [Rhizobium indigoferae]WRW39840.1 hypothetical protein U5G49_005197 [Rhizobium indigoferae]
MTAVDQDATPVIGLTTGRSLLSLTPAGCTAGADIFGASLLGLYVLIIRRHCHSPFKEEVTAVDMVPTMGWRNTDA